MMSCFWGLWYYRAGGELCRKMLKLETAIANNSTSPSPLMRIFRRLPENLNVKRKLQVQIGHRSSTPASNQGTARSPTEARWNPAQTAGPEIFQKACSSAADSLQSHAGACCLSEHMSDVQTRAKQQYKSLKLRTSYTQSLSQPV